MPVFIGFRVANEVVFRVAKSRMLENEVFEVPRLPLFEDRLRAWVVCGRRKAAKTRAQG